MCFMCCTPIASSFHFQSSIPRQSVAFSTGIPGSPFPLQSPCYCIFVHPRVVPPPLTPLSEYLHSSSLLFSSTSRSNIAYRFFFIPSKVSHRWILVLPFMDAAALTVTCSLSFIFIHLHSFDVVETAPGRCSRPFLSEAFRVTVSKP